MVQSIAIVAGVGVVLAVLAVAGWWRLLLRPFRIRTSAMTVGRLGLMVSQPDDVRRINALLESFSGGFNAMIGRPSVQAARRYCDALPSLFQPFAQEGLAMGYGLRRLWGATPERFEDEVVRVSPGFCYLHYVGLGFWSGMRKHSPARLLEIVARLDPLHGYLCYDGYGFKHAFFDYRERGEAGLDGLDRLEGYARNAAYQGVGRAFWFLYLDRIDVLVDHAKRRGSFARDIGAGLGLAAVFTHTDRLEVALRVGRELPASWYDDYHLGMCFGLKARAINDPAEFERCMARLEPDVRESALASVRECDRVEFEVRFEGGEDAYRRWRERVTEWMARHVEYPLAGLRRAAAEVSGPQTASSGGRS